IPAQGTAPVVCPEAGETPGRRMTTVTLITRTKRFLVLALLASLTLGPNLLGGSLWATVHAKDKGAKGSKDEKPNKKASDLEETLNKKSSVSLVKVILQLNQKPTGQLNALLASNGVKIKKHFNNLNSFALELPANVVNSLSNFPEVEYVSLDSEVMT